MEGVENHDGQQIQNSAEDPVEEQAERPLNRQQHPSPFHDRKIDWSQPPGRLSKALSQSDVSDLMKTEFQVLQNQLDVFLQAAASKIDDFGRHEPHRSSSEAVIPLESLSDLKLSIDEIAADHEAKLDQVEKNTKVEAQKVRKSVEKLAATHEASSKKDDDNYEELAHGLNQLLTENKKTADLVKKSSKDQAADIQKLAHNQAQHEERLQTAFIAMRSELSDIKSAVKDLHDQTHKEQGLDDEMKELRLRQIRQVSQVWLFLAPPSPSSCENMY